MLKNNLLNRRTIFILIAITALSTCLWGIYWGLYKGVIRFNYPSFKDYPVHGIDISHHQNDIEWSQLDKKYVQFVFIKATEGKDFKDRTFKENLANARYHNIPAGAYHFFTFCSAGKLQAEHFIKEVPTELISLPPAIDLEFGGNCRLNLSDDQLAKEINNYIQIVENYYQKKVIIYATQEFYQSHLTNQFLDNPLWIRDIYKQPNLKNDRKWLFWQYANRGKLKGINTFVDFNVFNGSKEQFNHDLIGETDYHRPPNYRY